MDKQFIDKSQWLRLPQLQRNVLKNEFGIKIVGGIIVVDNRVVEDGVDQKTLADIFNIENMAKFTGKKGTCDELWAALLDKMFNPSNLTAPDVKAEIVAPVVEPVQKAVKKVKKTQNVKKPKNKK